MSQNKSYRYLNRDTGLMYSPLYRAIESGQKRAPANQWPNIINSLKNKGVKEAEINDSRLLDHIADLEGPVTKEELLEILQRSAPLVKEIDVDKHKYKQYSYAKHGSHYKETLYVLAGEDDFLNDQLLDINYELEDLDFYPERLIDNPLLAHELHEKSIEIRQKINELTEKSNTSVSHWRDEIDPHTKQEINSLLFHSRSSLQENGETFLVEEVQSDWAQKGRQREWNGISKAPWVTNTEQWAGLAFRRLMQQAASNLNVKKFAWITGDYRNGGHFIRADGLNDFYIKVVGKLVNRALAGTGEKANFQTVTLGDKKIELPSFTMTDKVRAKLKEAQPLYSRDRAMRAIKQQAAKAASESMSRVVKNATLMLGDGAQIKLLSRLLDHENHPVSGRFLGSCIEVSLAGENPARALSHESWHYAYDHLLTPTEREVADNSFAPGGELLKRLTAVMKENGLPDAAITQCEDPHEAAAHAFSLWVEGRFPLGKDTPLPLEGVFSKVDGAFNALTQQVSYATNPERTLNSDEEALLAVFEALLDNSMAQRHASFAPPPHGG